MTQCHWTTFAKKHNIPRENYLSWTRDHVRLALTAMVTGEIESTPATVNAAKTLLNELIDIDVALKAKTTEQQMEIIQRYVTFPVIITKLDALEPHQLQDVITYAQNCIVKRQNKENFDG